MSRRRDPLYYVWYNMFRYCRSNKYYEGVGVCDKWRSRAAFEAWAMSHGWKRGLMLVRRDKSADFSPENCMLAPIAEANGLRRCVRRLPDGRSARDICGRAASRRAVQRTAFRTWWGRTPRNYCKTHISAQSPATLPADGHLRPSRLALLRHHWHQAALHATSILQHLQKNINGDTFRYRRWTRRLV